MKVRLSMMSMGISSVLLRPVLPSDIIEIRVVDEKGIIRATTEVSEQGSVGKKNDYVDMNDFTTKRYVALDDDGKRVNINIQPILSPTGDAVIGALYVKK